MSRGADLSYLPVRVSGGIFPGGLKRQRFLEFMRSDYMSDLLAFLGDDPMGGHALERSVSVYYMLKQWNAAELLGHLTHISADSHGTQGHKDRFDAHYGVP